MKISLITITKDNPKGLRRTLESVQSQLQELPEGVSLEHIIIDGSKNVCSEKNSHLTPVTTVYARSPKGVYNAINEGLALATGDVVGLLHSGDVFPKHDSLTNIIKQFVRNKDIDYVYGDVRIGKRLYKGSGFSEKHLLQGYAPPHPSLFITKKVLNTIGNYDESFVVAADFDYFIRLYSEPALKGLYLDITVVEMEPGGLSGKIHNVLFVNNSEKLRALRKNGLKASYFNILKHYQSVIKSFLCSSKSQNR